MRNAFDPHEEQTPQLFMFVMLVTMMVDKETALKYNRPMGNFYKIGIVSMCYMYLDAFLGVICDYHNALYSFKIYCHCHSNNILQFYFEHHFRCGLRFFIRMDCTFGTVVTFYISMLLLYLRCIGR